MKQIIIAGFGGQGILFAGKVLAYVGMIQGFNVSWLPSYGPETRGGTSNCSVIISEKSIGSPLILTPDVLVCMNLPSMEKFENTLTAKGLMLVNSSLIERKSSRKDLLVHYVPATALAIENGLDGLTNMIMIGKLINECALCDCQTIETAIRKSVSERKQEMVELNMKAIAIGLNFPTQQTTYHERETI